MNFMISKVAASCAAFASSVFVATLTVHAADRLDWTGGEKETSTAESPYNIWAPENWGGTKPNGSYDLHLSVTERTYIHSTNGAARLGSGLFPNSGEFVFTGPLWNFVLKAGGVANSTVSILKKSGDWTFSLNSNGSSQIGAANNSTVVFTNESGNVNITATAGCFHTIGSGAGSYARVVNLSGNWTFANSNNLSLAGGAGSTGIVENVSGDWFVDGDLDVARSGYGEFIQYGGSLTVGGDMYISHWSSGSGVLTIKSGTVTVASDKRVLLNAGNGTINLNRGTLVTPQVYRSGGTFTLNFNGGTLKANASADLLATDHDNMVVHVNAGGGVIDCGGYAVTLKPKIGRSGDTGSLTFTGGNIITIDNDINYGGVTYVVSNTTVKATNASISTLLTHGVSLVGALELNTPYTILASTAESDDWSSLDRSKVTCPSAAAFTADLGADGKSITVTVTAFKPGYWTGAAGDNNLSTAGNWSDNTVPTSGNATFECIAPAMLTKGASFAATSITFAEECYPVTIDGDFITLTSVTNNSSVNQTFAGFIDFGALDIDVTAPNATLSGTTVTGGCVVFAGGVKGAKVANHSIVSGNYTLTSDEAFTNACSSFTVNENSSLSVKTIGGWDTNDTQNLNIGEGATFCVSDVTREFSNGGSINNRLWNSNEGTFIVTNFTFTGDQYSWLGGNQYAPNANAALKVGTLTIDGSGRLALHGTGISDGTTLKMYIGEGGLNIASGKAGYYGVLTSAHRTTMYPWNSDFTFGRGSNANFDFLLGADKGKGTVNFTLNTDDEAGVPRTVTMDARIKTETNTWTIAVAGHGTNVVTSASPLMTGTYAVTGAATVVLKNGAGFANGTVSVGPEAALAVGESGTAKVGDLCLADGATLAFNWTKRSSIPVLAASGTVTVSGSVKVKVSACDTVDKPMGGARVLTFGGGFAGKIVTLDETDKPDWALGLSVNSDGNIVLDVEPRGFTFILK